MTEELIREYLIWTKWTIPRSLCDYFDWMLYLKRHTDKLQSDICFEKLASVRKIETFNYVVWVANFIVINSIFGHLGQVPGICWIRLITHVICFILCCLVLASYRKNSCAVLHLSHAGLCACTNSCPFYKSCRTQIQLSPSMHAYAMLCHADSESTLSLWLKYVTVFRKSLSEQIFWVGFVCLKSKRIRYMRQSKRSELVARL